MSTKAINMNKKIFLNHMLMGHTKCCDVANETVSAKEYKRCRRLFTTI